MDMCSSSVRSGSKADIYAALGFMDKRDRAIQLEPPRAMTSFTIESRPWPYRMMIRGIAFGSSAICDGSGRQNEKTQPSQAGFFDLVEQSYGSANFPF